MNSPEAGPVILDLERSGDAPVGLVGGKAQALGRLLGAPLPGMDGFVITTEAYRLFIQQDGLAERVGLEFARRPLSDSRDEELWDLSQRVRAAFRSTVMPSDLRQAIVQRLEPMLARGPVAVRSSSPQEDSAEHSFAGLHDSEIGPDTVDAALRAVVGVWASLYSERALLYRTELGSDLASGQMAVIVQQLASSDRSGVVFTQSPVDPALGEVEAVWGLGEGLVSGRVEPDSWSVDRRSDIVVGHVASQRGDMLVLHGAKAVLASLPVSQANRAPLEAQEVTDVWRLARKAEAQFGAPQDCEWTFDDGRIVLVQARPITTLPVDSRAEWQRRRLSEERLSALGERIENQLLPSLETEAQELADVDLGSLSEDRLSEQGLLRGDTVERWRQVYRSEFIPFAHGVRLFGRYYGDLVEPADPFEFLKLLVRTAEEYETHRNLLESVGEAPPTRRPASPGDRERLEAAFLGAAAPVEREHAAHLLELGRKSWRLRDDDNLYLMRLEQEADRSLKELHRRIKAAGVGAAAPAVEAMRHAVARLEGLAAGSLNSARAQAPSAPSSTRPRQLLGHPAGPGVGRGPARVATRVEDVRSLRPGEVLVVDALEPDTAAHAARAAGIVERRGGMLVHGAIVAREHGVPCVTGVPDATNVIRQGETVTVDGYLGIVVLNEV